jgi:hypothetical protein
MNTALDFCHCNKKKAKTKEDEKEDFLSQRVP